MSQHALLEIFPLALFDIYFTNKFSNGVRGALFITFKLPSPDNLKIYYSPPYEREI